MHAPIIATALNAKIRLPKEIDIISIAIVNIIEKLLPNESSNFTDEIKENIKQAIQDHLHNLDIVTREEFDIQKEVLLKTRLKIEELEKKIKTN